MKQAFQYDDNLEMDLQCYCQDQEKVDTAVQSLESIIQTQDFLTDGNKALDETTYKVIEHSIESFLKIGRIGVAEPLVPSNESFKGNYDISYATMEGIGAGIKNVFMSIINAIKKAIEWVGGLIKRLFGRGKDHDEKIAKLEHDAAEAKEAVKNLKPEEIKAAPSQRDSEGWFKTVKIHNPKILRNIVTSKGVMQLNDLNMIATELAGVFHKQGKNMQQAMQVKNGYNANDQHYDPPFPASTDATLLKKVSRNSGDKLYLSHEFGNGVFVYVLVPQLDSKKLDNEHDAIKETNRWVDNLTVGQLRSDKINSFEKYTELEGDLANPDKLLDNIKLLSKMLHAKTDELKNFQHAKETFIRDFEAQIKKEGVTIFSSTEKKDRRDQMVYQLKYFKKVMDQPALTYYGLCEGVLTSFENLAAMIIAYNTRNGNHVELKHDEVKAGA